MEVDNMTQQELILLLETLAENVELKAQTGKEAVQSKGSLNPNRGRRETYHSAAPNLPQKRQTVKIQGTDV